jgi:integrase
VEIFRKKRSKGEEPSKFYWYDFTLCAQRYRGSTGESNRSRAAKIAALVFAQTCKDGDRLPRRAPLACEVSKRFLGWIDDSDLAPKTKDYYRNGWRLLSAMDITKIRLDLISQEMVGALKIAGSASNINNVRRTMSRLLHKAEEWHLIRRAPRIKLKEEIGRKLQLDELAEEKLLAASADCGWKPEKVEMFGDILILMRDGGFRNEKELYPLRIEDLDWDRLQIHILDSKTTEGIRTVPMSTRIHDVLRKRAGTRKSGWVFPAKRSKSGHLTTMAKAFREARKKAGLSESLVLYCGRHNFGTRLLRKTGDLKLVMTVMGHKDPKSAMKYQPPDICYAGTAINALNEAVVAKGSATL